MTRLNGKVAIITGAARGQGAAEARLFVEEGASVVLTDVDEGGHALAAELAPDSVFLKHDVGDPVMWAHVVATTLARFGRVDILVNNAGIYVPGPLASTSLADFERHISVNQIGPFLGMQAVLAPMRAAAGGAIVNVSSAAAMRGLPGQLAYATTKWALRGMTKCAASELAPLGIRVNSVHPGLVDTPMLGGNSPEQLAALRAMVPMRRLARATEIADLVLFLCTDAASYITGAEIMIDGGAVL